MNPVESMKAARRAGVPVVVINTQDQPALIKSLSKTLPETAPVVAWDSVRGFTEMNALGKSAIKSVLGSGSETDAIDIQYALGTLARKFAAETVVFVINAHRYLKEDSWAQVAQAVSILRTEFLRDHRKLVLLGPAVSVPVELNSDVIVVDDPLPTDEAISAIVEKLHKQANVPLENKSQILGIGRGLSAFKAEQVYALSMTKQGIALREAWEQKRIAVNQVKGLKMEIDGPSFADFIGYEAVTRRAELMMKGPEPANVIVVIDELEKQLGGAFGEAHDGGVSKDALSTILQWMENDKHDGQINIGLGGTGKTLFASALGATYNIPTIYFDQGAMKGSLVSESENRIREAVRTITAIAGKGGAYVVATCNGFGAMPPELKRRFTGGFWYFEPPNVEARTAMWKHYAKVYGVELPASGIKFDALWTGAEIRNCCRTAYKCRISVEEAQHYIVPVALSDGAALDKLRKAADGKLIDASRGGYFDANRVADDTGRKIEL